MTLPDERYAAVKGTMNFLRDLSSGKFKRVPREVRDMANSLLRHYPDQYDLMMLERAAPNVIQERMEEVHRFIVQGSQQEE